MTRSPVAILALLVFGCVPADAQVPVRPYLGAASQADVERLQGPPAKVDLLPERTVGHRLQVPLVCRSGLLDIDAAAFFSPSGSWVRPDGKTPELLRHEQGHFETAKLYALRLRKAILDANVGCQDTAKANTAGQKMVSEFQKEWQDAEREYEEDTKYGTDLSKQNAASERIAAGFAAMSAPHEP
jgi:hypothetical protein